MLIDIKSYRYAILKVNIGLKKLNFVIINFKFLLTIIKIFHINFDVNYLIMKYIPEMSQFYPCTENVYCSYPYL